MSLRRHAETDAQERALANIENICKVLGISTGYAGHIGKAPQTVTLENRSAEREGFHYPTFCHINSDGTVSIGADGPEADLGSRHVQAYDLETFAIDLRDYYSYDLPDLNDPAGADLTPAEA